MKTLANIAGRFRAEEDGAAMIEYTVLLGVITVAVITTVIWVGSWVNANWGTLKTNLSTAGTQPTT